MLPVSCCRFLYVFGGRDVFSVFVEVDVIVRWAVGDNDKSRSETPSGVGRLQVQCANVMGIEYRDGYPKFGYPKTTISDPNIKFTDPDLDLNFPDIRIRLIPPPNLLDLFH
ncbi:hypothetical protein DY000_02061804 [Brassica cretica]|uniref:Uncharacterized protein n=1 Tax=Brassica cretica TaxID=69181 RepID=A0ABQ7APU8_BRACR|nr:hypothetical protein DY000_02061804 [Brassica cretica]